MWLDDPDKQDPYNRTNTDQPNTSVGAGGGVAAPTTGTVTNPSTNTPVQANHPSQNFGTVQDYLKGNQQQGEALGQQFTGKLDTSLANQKGAIDTAAKQAGQDIAKGTTAYDAGLVNTAVTDPTKVAGNSDQLQSFLNQWNAAYKGPSSFENSTSYAPAQAAASEAAQKGAEASTAGGRQQLLQDAFGVYGQGNQGLDQAVLQNSSFAPKVQQQAKDLGSVQDYLKQQATGVNAAATKAAADTAATQNQTKAAFTNNLSNFQTDLNKRVKDAQAPATAQATQLQADFASGNADKIAADLKAASPSTDTKTIEQYLTAYQQEFGKPLDLSNFYSYNPATAVTAANVATPEDYAKAEAYGKLTGQDYSGVLNPADAAKAGTTPAALSGINSGNISDYLKNQYTNAEIAKLGGSPTGPGGVSSNPDISGPSGPIPGGKPPTDIAGAIGGGLVGNTVGNLVGGGVIGGLIGSTIGGNSGLSQSINKSLGIGGGKKDAVVYLPPMNLPPMKAPANADPATTKMVVDIFNTPLSSAGSYHEGAVSDIVNRLDQLQVAKSKGQLSDEEFNAYAQPLEQWAQQASQKIMSASSQAANANKPAYNRLQQYLAPKNNNAIKAQ